MQEDEHGPGLGSGYSGTDRRREKEPGVADVREADHVRRRVVGRERLLPVGVGAGAIVASLMVPPLAASVGWQWTFVITGLMGFAWFAAWTILYRHPQQHPWLTEEDRALLPPQTSAAAVHRQILTGAIP